MNPSRPAVELVPIDASNWREALEVRIADHHLRFVAAYQPVVLLILAKSHVAEGGRGWRPFAIVAEERVVGVFAVATSERSCELLHLAIDHSRQREGLGRAALVAVIELLADEREVDELELTVHPENAGAHRLYRSTGFAPTGESRHGEPVWSRVVVPPAP